MWPGRPSVDEAALRARFGDMEGLLADLLSPFLDRLRALAAEAAAADLRRAEHVGPVMAGYLDAVLDHRAVVEAVVADAVGRRKRARPRHAGPVAGHAGRVDQWRRTSTPASGPRRPSEPCGPPRWTTTAAMSASSRAVVTEAAVAILLSAPGTETGL